MLVQDLARLFISPVIHRLALVAGQDPQRVFCKLRIYQERLIRGNYCVASEDRCKPWDAGRDDMLLPIRNLQGMEVTNAGAQRLIKDFVAAAKFRRVPLPIEKMLAPAAQALAECSSGMPHPFTFDVTRD